MITQNIIPFIRTETITNERGFDDVLESIYITILSNIQNSIGKSFGWIIDSVIDNTIP